MKPKHRRTGIRIAVLLVIAAPLIVGLVHYQRHTDLGIYFFQGSHYWFDKARRAESADEAKDHLQRIVNATQYGVNIAQNHVNSLDDASERLKMFTMLVEIAPNKHWEKLYRLDVERQIEQLESKRKGTQSDA